MTAGIVGQPDDLMTLGLTYNEIVKKWRGVEDLDTSK